MGLYEEAAQAAAEETKENFDKIYDDLNGESETYSGISFELPRWLTAPTGEGIIEDYLNHPLNFDNKKSTARILRGFSGMFGELNKALFDIALGVIEKVWKEKNEVQENVYRPQQ